MAEREGFEPPIPFGTTVFKTAAIDHSATPPMRLIVRAGSPRPNKRTQANRDDWREATWDEALDRTVAGFQAAKAAHGPTTFGIFSCSRSTNEVNFAAQKFSRTILGSNNIDSCNRT